MFEIKVDDNGEVIGVRTLERTVSPDLEQLYRREVEKLTFNPTYDNSLPAHFNPLKVAHFVRCIHVTHKPSEKLGF